VVEEVEVGAARMEVAPRERRARRVVVNLILIIWWSMRLLGEGND
jgi:hypothetical protein